MFLYGYRNRAARYVRLRRRVRKIREGKQNK
jgi:hypothetical protein